MKQSADEILGQLRDLTGPLPAPPPEGWPAWAWLAAVAVVVNLAILTVRWLRRPAPVLSPREEALAALDSLAGVPDMAALTTLDGLLRRFLGRVHDQPADRLTSAELLAALPSAAAWREVFAALDRAKFAAGPVGTDEWQVLMGQVQALIQAECGPSAGPAGG